MRPRNPAVRMGTAQRNWNLEFGTLFDSHAIIAAEGGQKGQMKKRVKQFGVNGKLTVPSQGFGSWNLELHHPTPSRRKSLSFNRAPTIPTHSTLFGGGIYESAGRTSDRSLRRSRAKANGLWATGRARAAARPHIPSRAHSAEQNRRSDGNCDKSAAPMSASDEPLRQNTKSPSIAPSRRQKKFFFRSLT
jgi:hypothetical protein